MRPISRPWRFSLAVLSVLGLAGLLAGCGGETAALYPAWAYSAAGKAEWGYIDADGRFRIEPAFEAAGVFQANGLAVVRSGGRHGVIDRAGKYIIPPEYQSIRRFRKGLAVAKKAKGRYVILDEKGRGVFESSSPVADYHEGLASFKADSGYGYLDREGRVAIAPQFGEAGPFKDGKALVKLAPERYALIDRSGAATATFRYELVFGRGGGFLVYRGKNSKYGYIDESGRVEVTPKLDEARAFRHGLAVVSRNGRYGIIDRRCRFVIQPVHDEAAILGERLVALGKLVKTGSGYSYLRYALSDVEGNLRSDFIYYDLYPSSNGLIPATDYTSSLMLTSSGKKARNLPVINGLGRLAFDGRILRAEIDGRLAYYDRSGKPVWLSPAERPLDGRRLVEVKFRPNRHLLAYYPQIEGLPEEAGQDVNARLRKLALRDFGGVRPWTEMDFAYDCSYRIVLHRGDLLVIEFTGYLNNFGAVHGMPMREHIHLNLRTGRIYRLADLFRDDADYLDLIGGIVRREIERAPEDYFVEQFTGIDPEQSFAVTPRALQVYFQPYEIAPYAAGFPSFDIPYAELLESIDTEGDLWRAIAGLEPNQPDSGARS